MTFRDQDSRSRLEVQVRGETETRLSKMCLETRDRSRELHHYNIHLRSIIVCRAGHQLFAKKSSLAVVYRYSNKKVAPLPLLACKTAANPLVAATTLKKINGTKNDGIQIRYLMVKFHFIYESYLFKPFRYWFRLQSALAGLNSRQVSKSPFN